MNQVNEKCGTDYKPFNYYGAPDAEKVIIAMGSVCDTAEEVLDYLTAAGEKVGLVKVRLYRPFVAKYLLDVLPKTVKSISVLDRTKEPGSIGEPLYLDVVAALKGTEFETTPVNSGVWVLTVPLVQTKTPLKLLVTKQTCMHKVTLHMTLRNPVVLPFLTCVLVTNRLKVHTTSTKQTLLLAIIHPILTNMIW